MNESLMNEFLSVFTEVLSLIWNSFFSPYGFINSNQYSGLIQIPYKDLRRVGAVVWVSLVDSFEQHCHQKISIFLPVTFCWGLKSFLEGKKQKTKKTCTDPKCYRCNLWFNRSLCKPGCRKNLELLQKFADSATSESETDVGMKW